MLLAQSCEGMWSMESISPQTALGLGEALGSFLFQHLHRDALPWSKKAEPSCVFKDHRGEAVEELLPQELPPGAALSPCPAWVAAGKTKCLDFPSLGGSDIPIFIPLSLNSVFIYSQMWAAGTELDQRIKGGGDPRKNQRKGSSSCPMESQSPAVIGVGRDQGSSCSTIPGCSKPQPALATPPS